MNSKNFVGQKSQCAKKEYYLFQSNPFFSRSVEKTHQLHGIENISKKIHSARQAKGGTQWTFSSSSLLQENKVTNEWTICRYQDILEKSVILPKQNRKGTFSPVRFCMIRRIREQ